MLFVFLVLLVVAAGVAVWLLAGGPREMQSMVLRFGRDVTGDQVTTALGLVAGLPRRSVVVLDTIGSCEGISYRLHAPRSVVEALRHQLTGVVPSLRLEPFESETSPAAYRAVVRVETSPRLAALRGGQSEETTAALLGALSGQRPGEEVLVRWRLAPTRTPRLPALPTRSQTTPAEPLAAFLGHRERMRSAGHLKALQRKQAEPVLAVEGLVAARAGHPARAGQIAGRVTSVLRSRSTPHGRLRPRPVSRRRGERLLRLERSLPRGWWSPGELSGVLGWPVGAPTIPGLELGTAPQLLAPRRLPSGGRGRVFATSTWPGQEDRRLLQPEVAALQHSLVLGPTGVGKSAMLTNLATQSIALGHGVVLIDMKADTADDVLSRIPEERVDDVIVLEPASGLPMPGLQVFGKGDPEVVADVLLGTFRGIFKDSWGVRSEQYLRLGLVTLAHDPEATLADLGRLFSDAGYRRRLVGRLDSPWTESAWASFEALSPAQQQEHLASPLRKINEVVGRRVVRSVLAQPSPTFDLRRDVLDGGKILVVALPVGRLGEAAAQLLGALVVHQLYTAVLARQEQREGSRRPADFYLDEAKVLLSGVPIPLDAAFELFRGLGCGITLAGQSAAGLPKAVQQAALNNAGSIVAFRQNRADAALLAQELPQVTSEGLQHLGRYEVAMRLSLGPGDVASTVTGRTLPPTPPVSDPDEVRRRSAARYGVDPAVIDAQLRQRQGTAPGGGASRPSGPEVGAAPVGRRPRRSS